ncbi:hypothetical protein CY34DRAFT_15615 [Suillus luteus UH-Slu-Lm8-n1]|uniref:Uncharacterized protein n=1 Tax=Suillus luteus UH-Slu-Lm8-n1 TaxID=930992 RepID=A0A0D0B0I4_9AGAM|nr:hypothetical protein CY34DRAFT_15615 [Suillus luteus UH-Slu-Lm8-n1]
MSSSKSITSTSTGIRSSSSSSPGVAISAYTFGFLIISVFFLFVIVGCCFCRWRPGALLWDTSEQLDGRDGRRRKLIPPVLWDTWLSRPPVLINEVLGAGQLEWLSIQVYTVPMFLPFVSDDRFQQPVHVSLIHACHSQSTRSFTVAVSEPEEPVDPSTVAWLLPDNSQSSSPSPSSPRRRFASPLAFPFYFHMWPRRRSRAQYSSAPSEKPTEGAENHPEAVEIAVMISMPSSAFRCWNHKVHKVDPLNHSAGPNAVLREYQIGVAQVAWIQGEARTQC